MTNHLVRVVKDSRKKEIEKQFINVFVIFKEYFSFLSDSPFGSWGKNRTNAFPVYTASVSYCPSGSRV